MELRLYNRPGTAAPEVASAAEESPRRWWRPRWLEEFERWAAPEVEPEQEEERERSFYPVGVLLGLALLAQYGQLWIPSIHAYLIDGDVTSRGAWAVFTVLKQATLFTLMLVVVLLREERLASIGFPKLEARRVTLALGLVLFFLGAALVRSPQQVLSHVGVQWMVPVGGAERAIWVLLGLTAAVVEETFFRGFAVVWTYRWSGSLPLAVLLPAAVFAAGHAYLGWVNVGFAFVAALAFSVILLWRRDLYWAMVIHLIIDCWSLLA